MSEIPGGDPLLSDLCIICHINPPKYRCPRCATRTCSLPCSRRHKLWSQCSGVRDPAAYLRRNELATPAAFDRDFNFITGIERSVERADRDAENRGVHIDHGHEDEGTGRVGEKRKRPGNDTGAPGGGLVKGEAGFLRGAQSGEVQVIRAPRGMTRNKQNTSRWHPNPDGEKEIRTCLESCRVAEAYDRFYPLPKQERKKDLELEQGKEQKQDLDQQDQVAEQEQKQEPSEQGQQPEQTPPKPEQEPPIDPQAQRTEQPPQPEPTDPSPANEITNIIPHREVYFYLHRPRTTTKQPVLIPLAPEMTLTGALRCRTVLEFPTLYILPDSPETLRAAAVDKEGARFILEEEYLQTEGPSEEGQMDGEDVQGVEGQTGPKGVDLGQVDEKKVLEVLKQDLFEPVPPAAAVE